MPKMFIKQAIKHPGALHKELHVPEGKKIPNAKLAAAKKRAKKTGNAKLSKRLVLAKTLAGFRKTGPKHKGS